MQRAIYKADVLLVSDGEFPLSAGLSGKINNPMHYVSEWGDLKMLAPC